MQATEQIASAEAALERERWAQVARPPRMSDAEWDTFVMTEAAFEEWVLPIIAGQLGCRRYDAPTREMYEALGPVFRRLLAMERERMAREAEGEWGERTIARMIRKTEGLL